MRHLVAALTGLTLLLAGCTSDGESSSAAAAKRPATWSVNVEDGAQDVPVDTLVEAAVDGGSIGDLELTPVGEGEPIEGEGSQAAWRATERLEPGTEYVLTGSARGADGADALLKHRFRTVELSLDELTYPSVAPLAGETVGVGMPVIVSFDIPVQDRALFEEHMEVRSEPAVEGAWHWLSDSVVHYRPKEFWPAGTEVTVDLDLNSLPAGNGVYGQQDQQVPFRIGREVVTTVDIAAHTLSMSIDGALQRTIPVSTGKPGHETRAGTKVIMEKFDAVDMDAASTGVSEDDADYYDISDVQWAMRVTNSGEFLHAAPWSVGSQGRENVSHGCVGMSTADAKWVYDRSKRGDVVRFVNSGRPLEPHNGWTDWNIDWSDWTAGSALSSS